MTGQLRVLVADDHPVVRSGLVGMLDAEPDIEIVGEADNGVDAVRLSADLAPDVVLMDLRMPGLDGADATKQILDAAATDHAPTTATRPRVLVLTTFETDADIVRAVEAGAAGYLLKDTPIDILLAGIRSAARGETVLAPSVAARLANSVRRTNNRLTPRETEILELVADGRTNQAIALHLHISEATVKTHLIRIYNKLGVDNRTEAVTEARHLGWLTG